MRPPAFSYYRLSTTEQLKGQGLERQTALAAEYAARNSLALDERSFRDLGVSAFKGKNLEEGALAAFIEAVKRRRIPRDSWLLVENLDRLSRLDPLRAVNSLRDILELGITVVTLQDGKRWTRDSLSGRNFGDLMLSMVTAQRAWEESDSKSRRVTASWESRRKLAAAERRPMTGRCVAWLRLEKGRFVPIPQRVRVVQQIFRWAAAGVGGLAITRKLNGTGVPTIGRAGAWSEAYVKKILKSAAVIGTLKLMKGDEFADYYPPIVDKATWLKVQARRTGRKLPPGPRTFNSLFSRLAKCGVCGTSLQYVNKGPKPSQGAWLVCSNRRLGGRCQARAWRYTDFERVIIGTLHTELDWHRLAPTIRDAVSEAIENLEELVAIASVELDQVRTRERRIVTAIEDGGDTRALTERLRELEREEARLSVTVTDVNARLEAGQNRIRRATHEAKEIHAAVAEFLADSSNPEKREQMSGVLRDVVEEIRLATTTAEIDLRTEVLGAKSLVVDLAHVLETARAAARRRGPRRSATTSP